MRTTIVLQDNPSSGANYVGYAPARAQLRLADPGAATAPVAVSLRNLRDDVGGQVVFSTQPSIPGTDQLQLTLPIDGSPVSFWVGGRFQRPSTADRDAAIQVTDAATGEELSVTQLMVRVRKNADKLTTEERNRFLSAMAQLNAGGTGRFRDFRAMHTAVADREAHGGTGFLSWHRAYLLDLERELQAIDASVALPYWRFDEPAPNLFSPEFIGHSPAGFLTFSANNPLLAWRTDGSDGITRAALFDTATSAASGDLGPVLTEAKTLALGDDFSRFWRIQGNPHGPAHRSFVGYIDSPSTAPKDPLFFLLHANVDRLWAKWQWLGKRFDPESEVAFVGSGDLGHRRDDTMWPWNQDIKFPRPPAPAPGGTLADSALVRAPGPEPRVRDMIDYQGLLDPDSRLGFDYDDVPFQPLPT